MTRKENNRVSPAAQGSVNIMVAEFEPHLKGHKFRDFTGREHKNLKVLGYAGKRKNRSKLEDPRIYRMIAKDYNIDPSHVSDIKNRKTWKWLEDAPSIQI